MPLPFCTSHPERKAPFADNRHNICRRVFLQGDLGTNPGSGEGERELMRSVTITLKPSLENPKKKKQTCKQKKYPYVNAMSLALRGELLHPSRHACSQKLALFCSISLSAITMLWMIWGFFLYSFLFSHGLSIFCTTEFNWYVMFYYPCKI